MAKNLQKAFKMNIKGNEYLAARPHSKVTGKAKRGNARTDRAGGNKQAAVAGLDQARDGRDQMHQVQSLQATVRLLLHH